MPPFLPTLTTHGPIRVATRPGTSRCAYAALLAEAPRTGWCPVLVTDPEHLTPPEDPAAAVAEIGRAGATDVLARGWPVARTSLITSPYDADPVGLAAEYAAQHPGARLALVSAARPAHVPVAAGWTGTINYGNDNVGLSTVLRDWEERFGARLVMMQTATLWLSVATPPRTPDECLRVAAEHHHLCPDVDGEDPRPLPCYAAELRGRSWWRLWWD